ncbi:MAG: hypothetical protein ACYTBX_01025, partial [Planctomycetota bacterium]
NSNRPVAGATTLYGKASSPKLSWELFAAAISYANIPRNFCFPLTCIRALHRLTLLYHETPLYFDRLFTFGLRLFQAFWLRVVNRRFASL